MPTPEKEIEYLILDWLNSIVGCFAFKINTTGIYDPTKRTFRKNMNPHVHRGTCDIIGEYKGRFFAIEVKAGYQKPNDNQHLFMRRIRANGGIAFWINDFEKCKKEFIAHFQDIRFERDECGHEILFNEVL